MRERFVATERFRADLRDALLEHAAGLEVSDPALPAGARVRRPRSRRFAGLRVLPTLALGAVVAAAFLVLRSGGAVAPQRATAASVLRASAAALARGDGSRALGRRDYFYTRTAEWWSYAGFSPHPYVVRSIEEEWMARDGDGRSRYQVVGLSGSGVNRSLPFARSLNARLRAAPRPFILSTLPAPGILFSYGQLRRLPTDPTKLGAALNLLATRYRVNQLYPASAYRAAIRFAILRGLAEAPTSAAVRAALYRLLATTPGIHLLGRTRDSIGRYGMAVAIDVQDVELEMIIAPSTGELLETSRTLLHRSRLFLDGKQPPGLVNRATFLASGIVKSTNGRVQ